MDNKTLEIMKTRRSVRGFIPGKMPESSLIDKVIEAGTYAPTGRGKQSPVIVAVTNKETRDLLSKLNAEVLGVSSDPFYGAPVVLVVLADKSVPTYIYDGSLVMGNLMNAAHAVGLASCWIHRAKESMPRRMNAKIRTRTYILHSHFQIRISFKANVFFATFL